jgi:hypothetical protein
VVIGNTITGTVFLNHGFDIIKVRQLRDRGQVTTTQIDDGRLQSLMVTTHHDASI